MGSWWDESETTTSEEDEERAAATGSVWVALLAQAIGPVWMIFVGMLDAWGNSAPGESSRITWWVGGATLMSAVAWVVQLLLTGYRRRRGSRAASGVVFVVLGGVWTSFLVLVTVGTTR